MCVCVSVCWYFCVTTEYVHSYEMNIDLEKKGN